MTATSAVVGGSMVVATAAAVVVVIVVVFGGRFLMIKRDMIFEQLNKDCSFLDFF